MGNARGKRPARQRCASALLLPASLLITLALAAGCGASQSGGPAGPAAPQPKAAVPSDPSKSTAAAPREKPGKARAPRPAPPPKSRGKLDGLAFRIALTENGIDAGNDTLIFAAAAFESAVCREYGFGRAPYTTGKASRQIRFKATQTSLTEGAITWSGAIRGNRVKGVAEWKRGRETIRYKFRGTQVKQDR